MTIILTKKATEEQVKKMCYEFGSYIKVVADIKKGILAGGAAMHYDEEQVLLEYGCKQENLWGGGIDFQTSAIDYNSMINTRPNQENFSRDIQSQEIRDRLKSIVEKLLLWIIACISAIKKIYL